MDKYFESEAICKSCNINTKKENQIVCDSCHNNELKSEFMIEE